jgi:hypothetical protein
MIVKDTKMKKYIIFIIIIATLSISFLKQNYAAEKINGLIQSNLEQTKLYRKLIREVDFQYKYKPGDKLKYKVQIKTWTRKYIDLGPSAFYPNTVNLILEEQVRNATGENIELVVKVAYKNIREPFYWGPSISVYETEGKVFVTLYNHSWIPKISNIDIKSDSDFKTIESILKKVIAQIHRPIFFQNWDPNPPGHLAKGIEVYSWGYDGRFLANMHSVIRNFGNFKNFECAVVDNIIETSLGNKKRGITFGTVYFDYINGRVIKLDYSGSEESYHKSENNLKGIACIMLSAEILD